jgi:orotate phosphoribosyltransferase-like protein
MSMVPYVGQGSPSMMLLINGTTSGRSANKTVRTMSNVTSGLSVGSVIVNSGEIQTITDLPIAEKLAIQKLESVFLEKI